MAAAARAGENGRVAPEEHSPADWADACQRILDAGGDGVYRVHATLAGAARRLAGAAGASVVAWGPDGARPLAASGGALPLPARRLAAGVTAGPTGVVASVDVRGEIDLVVWWSGSPHPGSDLLEQLRLLARLAASVCKRDGAALSSLYAVARQLLASRDREEVLLGLATAAADVLDAEIAGVFLATPDGAHLEAQAVVGHRSMATARLRLARGESMVGHVFATGEVYRSDDWTTDPVISKKLLPVATMEGTKACIGAPMRVEGAVVGVLAAWRRRRSVYTDVDVALIGTLADLAALGVARALDDDRLRDLSEQLMTANSELAQRYEETRQTLEIHRRLMRVVVDGAGLGTVVEALRAITGKEVAFVGPDAARADGWLEAILADDRDGTMIGEKAVLLGPGGAGRHAIAVDVGSAGQRWGRLAVATGTPVATRDVVATEQAAVACALLLSRQDAAAGAMRRLEAEFVGDERVRRRVFAAVRDELRGGNRGLAGTIGPDTVVIIRAHGAECTARRLLERVAALAPTADVAVGMSDERPRLGNLESAYKESLVAVAMALRCPSRLLRFLDLGLHRLLFDTDNVDRVDEHVERWIGPLLRYDAEHKARLVETLACYLAGDGHQGAARRLAIHPSTLKYRLGRIRSILGVEFTHPETRFNIELALRLTEDVRSLTAIDSGGPARSPT